MTDQSPVLRANPLRMDNDFARATMAVRIPAILRQVQAANPDYPAAIQRALDALHEALTHDEPIPMLNLLPVPQADYDEWRAAYEAQRAISQPLTWQHAEWFFAETYFYRLLLQEVRWFETGRDPFAPIKQAELGQARFRQVVETALNVEGDFTEKLDLLLALALWSNRVDLSHQASELADEVANEADLLVDDRAALRRYLESVAADDAGTLHLIADNAGTELAMDLVLADHWTSGGGTAVLHLKSHPTYVSDATVPDVWHVLRTIESSGGALAALAWRLRAAWADGRLTLAAHPFWTSSRFLPDMPPALQQAFHHARLVILKGDANYRRATRDTLWDPDLPFAAVMRDFPAPLLVLRTIKSDIVVNLPADRVRELDAAFPDWRITGRYGLIQFSGPSG